MAQVKRVAREVTVDGSSAVDRAGGGVRVLVTGAGGFIGHHLTKYLVARGYWVRGVDIKEPEYAASVAHEFRLLDLRTREGAQIATRGLEEVYHLEEGLRRTSWWIHAEPERAGRVPALSAAFRGGA